MKPLGYENVKLGGELAARNIKNLARLHDRRYRPGTVGTKDAENVGWPGDWEGRTILALTILGQTLSVEPAFLHEIVREVLSNCNEYGYRGERLDLARINEQQLAGHGWLLRGLTEYYKWKGDPFVLDAIERIVKGLYLPVASHFSSYPVGKEERTITRGSAAGHLADSANEWMLSTDIGCAFISLDGLSQVYELTGNPKLAALIDEMIDVYFRIDYLGITAQTHAMLTAMRGVMRMHEITGRVELLEQALDFFRLYKREGMTENYANFNLFHELIWTEPCGIIDSFMLAMSLWEQTDDPALLEDAHMIWYNGVERGQRPNGGFGCDTCVDDGLLGVYEHFFEAYWCCSMRGGEGLGAPVRHCFYEDDTTILLPFYLDAVFTRECGEKEIIKETSHYPVEGKITIEVLRGSESPLQIKMFTPSWARNVGVYQNGEPVSAVFENGFVSFVAPLVTGTSISLCFDIPLLGEPTIGSFHAGRHLHTLRHGSLLLGSENISRDVADRSKMTYLGEGKYCDGFGSFIPINQSYLLEEDDIKRLKYRILFRI